MILNFFINSKKKLFEINIHTGRIILLFELYQPVIGIQIESTSYYYSNRINQLLAFKRHQAVITIQKLCSIKWNQLVI